MHIISSGANGSRTGGKCGEKARSGIESLISGVSKETLGEAVGDVKRQ